MQRRYVSTDFTWTFHIVHDFLDDVRPMTAGQRAALVKKVQLLAQGSMKAWRPGERRVSKELQLWDAAVETTMIGTARIMWWVELDPSGCQILVVYRFYVGCRC